MAEVAEDFECFAPRGPSGRQVAGGVVVVAEVAEDAGLAVLVADIPVGGDGPLTMPGRFRICARPGQAPADRVLRGGHTAPIPVLTMQFEGLPGVPQRLGMPTLIFQEDGEAEDDPGLPFAVGQGSAGPSALAATPRARLNEDGEV